MYDPDDPAVDGVLTDMETETVIDVGKYFPCDVTLQALRLISGHLSFSAENLFVTESLQI